MKVRFKNVILITTLFLLSVGDVFSQRILSPIKGQSLVSAPILLIRSGNISDLEINNISFPDTVSLGEMVTISAYLENTGTELFDGNININLDFEIETEVDLNDPESDDVIEDQQLTNVVLNPGESMFFTKDVMIDPVKVDPNSTNVVIVWPAFRIGLNGTSSADEPNYSLVSFFTMGLSFNPLNGGKILNSQTPNLKISNIHNKDNVQFDSYLNLFKYISKSNIKFEQGTIYSADGKILKTFNDIPFSSNQFNDLKKNQNTFFIVSMRVKNPVKQQHVYVKTHTLYW